MVDDQLVTADEPDALTDAGALSATEIQDIASQVGIRREAVALVLARRQGEIVTRIGPRSTPYTLLLAQRTNELSIAALRLC